MKKATIIHNPGAGDETHGQRGIITMIESLGYECRYISTKDNFKSKMRPDNDLIVIAGGDGTVRKLTKKVLLEKDFKEQLICLLPKGTANNIAYTLGLKDSERQIRQVIKKENELHLDIWQVERVKGVKFFIEALGFGLFPALINDMRNLDARYKDEPEKKLGLAVDKLHILTHELAANQYEIYADGKNFSGKYLMVELMNIKSIGPNMTLAPDADPSDGMLDLVLIDEKQRDALCKHLKARSQGKRSAFKPEIVRASEVSIVTDAKLAHADDELVDLNKKYKIKVYKHNRQLHFFVP